MEQQADGGEPDPRRWLVFGLVSGGLLMPSIDQTAVATALTSIGTDLAAPLAWTSWTITIYALGMIVSLPVAGRLSEQFGRKRVFLAAIALFTLASGLSGLAQNLPVLVLARVVQGIAAGAIMPSAAGLVADRFGRDRDRAIGMFTSVLPIGAIVGPLVGGLLLTVGGWRLIFLVNLVPGGLVLLLSALLRDGPGHRRRQPVDLPGIALLTTTLVSGMTAITRAGVAGAAPWRDPAVVACAVLTVAAAWGFLRHSRRRSDAIVPMRLLRGGDFGRMNTINFLLGAATFGFAALVPLYAQIRYGLAPLASATLLTARAVGVIGTSVVSVALLRRAGHRLLMIVGFVTLVAGLVLLALPAPGSPLPWLVLAAASTGLGMGMAAPAANNASLHLAPGEVSALSGLRGMFRQSGSIVAVSAATSIVGASSTPGITQAWIFVGFAVLLATAIPLVLRVPDHRGSW